jgi:hypothetical protein
MKLTANALLVKIQDILGVRLTGIYDYLRAEGLQNSVAGKAFARQLMGRSAARKYN